jgi:serine/threonine protein kinase
VTTLVPQAVLNRTAESDEPEQSGWDYDVGQEIAPGLHAWELLGDGMRLETWLAWSTVHWAPVTVKVPLPTHVRSDRAIASLRREADHLRDLRHPSFQLLLEERLDSGMPLLVCEYVEGPSLASVVEDGPLSAIDTVLVGLQLASALHHLHQRGVVHLDLKPGNVLVQDGRVVLIDLGLARPVGYLNPSGRARGTRDYMAPEQCRMEPADPRMDLFALGTVLYELSVGEQAFTRGDDEIGQYAQLVRSPTPAPDLQPDFPMEFWSVLDWLLQPSPADRAQSAADVLLALHRLIPPNDEGLWPDWVTDLLVGESATSWEHLR